MVRRVAIKGCDDLLFAVAMGNQQAAIFCDPIDYPPQRRSRSHVAPKDLAPDKGENIVSAIVKAMDGQKTAKITTFYNVLKIL